MHREYMMNWVFVNGSRLSVCLSSLPVAVCHDYNDPPSMWCELQEENGWTTEPADALSRTVWLLRTDDVLSWARGPDRASSNLNVKG